MVYITTTKFLNIPQEADENASVVVFYKESETVKMTDVASLISSVGRNIDMIAVEDRDDMLIMLGGWFVNHEDDVIILDPSIPVPKKYADRVHKQRVSGTKNTTRKRTSKKIKETVKEDSSDIEVDKTVQTISDIFPDMNPPVDAGTEKN